MSVKKTFRFDDVMADDLVRLSKAWDVGQTEAIRRAIHEAIQRLDGCTDDDCTDDHTLPYAEAVRIAELEATVRELRETLSFERSVLREQMDTVNRLTETTAQAQTLQAAEKVESLPWAQESPEMRHWWNRVFDSFRNRQR